MAPSRRPQAMRGLSLPLAVPSLPCHREMPLRHLQNAGLMCGSGSLLR